MLSGPWWGYSIIAAVLWGLHFNLVVKVVRILPRDIYTPLSVFFITGLSIYLALPFLYKKIFANLAAISNAGTDMRLAALGLVLSGIAATTCLYIAMQLSTNATVAALMDITYPLFVALIAWWLFKENHIDWSVLVGGAFILTGSAIIIWKHG